MEERYTWDENIINKNISNEENINNIIDNNNDSNYSWNDTDNEYISLNL